MIEVERASLLPADAADVWERCTTAAGINDELWPLCRMTVPPGGLDLDVGRLEPPVRLGRSWILVGGVLPVDYDDLCIEELAPGRFLEHSRTSTLDPWIHERNVTEAGSNRCLVRDCLRLEVRAPLGRLPGAGSVAAAVVGSLFTHRHRRLRRHWGEVPPAG